MFDIPLPKFLDGVEVVLKFVSGNDVGSWKLVVVVVVLTTFWRVTNVL